MANYVKTAEKKNSAVLENEKTVEKKIFNFFSAVFGKTVEKKNLIFFFCCFGKWKNGGEKKLNIFFLLFLEKRWRKKI